MSSRSRWNIWRRESSTWRDFRRRTLRVSSPIPSPEIFTRTVLPSRGKYRREQIVDGRRVQAAPADLELSDIQDTTSRQHQRLGCVV